VGPAGKVGSPGQPEVGLVDEGSGLKRVTGRLGRELCSGERAKLVLDKQQKAFGAARIASPGVGQVFGVGHMGQVYRLIP
jgi:hypothetical protein